MGPKSQGLPCRPAGRGTSKVWLKPDAKVKVCRAAGRVTLNCARLPLKFALNSRCWRPSIRVSPCKENSSSSTCFPRKYFQAASISIGTHRTRWRILQRVLAALIICWSCRPWKETPGGSKMLKPFETHTALFLFVPIHSRKCSPKIIVTIFPIRNRQKTWNRQHPCGCVWKPDGPSDLLKFRDGTKVCPLGWFLCNLNRFHCVKHLANRSSTLRLKRDSGWWFQPLWTILVSWDYYSQCMEK